MLSENIKISKLYSGAADAVDCDVVNMENFISGSFVVIHTGSADGDLTLSLYEASSIAPSNAQAITTAVPLAVDTDMGIASDTLVAQTAAYSYVINTTGAGDRNQMVCFDVDPAILSAGFPCVYLADSGGHGSNNVVILFIGQPKYKSASLPTALA